MHGPLVSVIMIVRNGERFLRSAIESVLKSDYGDFEIVLIDGLSTDDTAKIAKSFKGVRIFSQEGTGIADAYNAGIDASQGEFLAFLSSDDLWEPRKLRIQMSYLLCHPDIQYTVTNFKYFLEPGYEIPAGFKKNLLEGEHPGFIMETLVVRKSVFREIGRFNPAYTIGEDVDWYSRAKDHHIPMAVIPECLLHKRVHDANASSDSETGSRNILKILRDSVARKHSEETPHSTRSVHGS